MSFSTGGSQLIHVPSQPFDPSIWTYSRFAWGFEPSEFTGWVDESMSWKETCYIGDWTPLFKFRVRGREALGAFSDGGINSLARFDVGQAKHCVFCNAKGKVMGEGVLMREAEDQVQFISGPGVPWARWVFDQGGYDAVGEDVTDSGFIFQVSGPNSLPLLEHVTGESLRDIGFMRFRTAEIAGAPVVFLRQGMAGEIGYELQGPIEAGPRVYEAIVSAGEAFGIRRLGGRTKMVNHAEACFPTPTVDFMPAFVGDANDAYEQGFVDRLRAGNPQYERRFAVTAGSFVARDLRDYHRSPVELGWGKSIKLDHDFRGRAALEAELENPRRSIVTLVWNAEDVLDVSASLLRRGDHYTPFELPRNGLGTMWADDVQLDGRSVGVSTSRTYSLHFREMISLCVIDIALKEPGTEVEVIWGAPGTPQKRIRATVAPAPYKTDNRKLDVTKLAS